MTSLTGKPQLHVRVWQGILEGIIGQNGQKLDDGSLIRCHSQILCDLCADLGVVHVSDSLKCVRSVLHSLAEVERLHLQLALGFLQPGQADQVLDESPEFSNLFLRPFHPLIVWQIHCEDVHIGSDDRERGFQLVTGICDEALLLLHAFPKRPDRLI